MTINNRFCHGIGWITLFSLSSTVLLMRRMDTRSDISGLQFSLGVDNPRQRYSEFIGRELDMPRQRYGAVGSNIRSLKMETKQSDNSNEAPQEHSVTKRNHLRTPHENAFLPWPKPDGWEEYGFYKTRHHFKCKAYAHDQTKPLPTLEDWQVFKDTYKEVVDDPATEFNDVVPSTEGYTLSEELGPAPAYPSKSNKGGRGLFAARDIKKGELVFDGEQSDFTFPNAMAWRQFIFALPREKACDMIDWCWMQKTEKHGKYQIRVAMNVSILLNSCGGKSNDANVLPSSSIATKMYATRDIKKDEELLTDYKMYKTHWDEVGLGYTLAEKVERYVEKGTGVKVKVGEVHYLGKPVKYL